MSKMDISKENPETYCSWANCDCAFRGAVSKIKERIKRIKTIEKERDLSPVDLSFFYQDICKVFQLNQTEKEVKET